MQIQKAPGWRFGIISLEEQQGDSGSLFNHYKKIIAIRKSSDALANGAYRLAENDQDDFFSFIRYTREETVLVVLSLSDVPKSLNVKIDPEKKFKTARSLLNQELRKLTDNRLELELPPYGLQVFKLQE